MTAKSTQFDLQKKIKRLEEIEASFQKPDFNLEEALELHTEALAIAKEVQEYLATAQQRLEKIDISALRRES